MPAFVALLSLLIGVAAQQWRIIAMQGQLGTLARMVESGTSVTDIRSIGDRFGLPLSIVGKGGIVCLTATAPMKLLGLTVEEQNLRACGLAPGT